MLTLEEERLLVRDLIGSAEVLGQAMSPSAAALMVADLEGIPLTVIRQALRSIRSNYKGRLTFPVIRERVLEQDGRLGRDEAWALALQSIDERESVVWTAEIQAALEAARPVLDAGDKIGARMAFLSAYDRLLQSARDTMKPCEWAVSIGWDGDRRALAVDAAVRLGRIPVERALAIGYDQNQAISADGRAIVALLAGPSSGNLLSLTSDEKTRAALLSEGEIPASMPEKTAKHLAELRKSIAASNKAREARRKKEVARKARELQDKKDRAAAMVRERQQNSS